MLGGKDALPAASPRWKDIAGYTLFALSVLLGIWLRLHQIADQIIADDECHSLYAVINSTYEDIRTHFGGSDYCIPMTLFAKLVANTVGLDELGMRALPLFFGIAALIVIPWMLRPIFGPKTSLLFAWLLAISPLHVYFSRYARPYAVVFFLAVVGALAFERWFSGGGRRWAWIYAACAILAPWFHAILLPFSLAPILYALLRARSTPGGLGAMIRKLLPLGLAIAIGLALLLGPPLRADYATISGRSGGLWISAESLKTVYDLFSGTHLSLTGFVFGLACLAGLLSMWRRRRAFLLYLLFLLGCQVGALAISRPVALEVAIVLVRYCLPALAVGLLLAAEGLSGLDDLLRGEWRRFPRHLVSTAMSVAFVAYGPLVPFFYRENATYYTPNAWTNHAVYQYLYARRSRWDFAATLCAPRRISPFYVRLGVDGEREPIVEAPWFYDWSHSPFFVYQRIHRRPMFIGIMNEPGDFIGPGDLPWPDPRFRFRNFVHLGDYEGLRERGVRFVVMHKNLGAELPAPSEPLKVSLESWVRRYMQRFGSPCFEDVDLYVFDLQKSP